MQPYPPSADVGQLRPTELLVGMLGRKAQRHIVIAGFDRSSEPPKDLRH